jgi:hypothetical protein
MMAQEEAANGVQVSDAGAPVQQGSSPITMGTTGEVTDAAVPSAKPKKKPKK